jgi:replication fork clamp-binding protein CrfC
MKLTVFYNGQFWMGVVEAEEDGHLKAAHRIFGSSEPSDPEVYAFVLQELPRLLEGVRATVATEAERPRRINPKRLAREVAREVAQHGISSKAQEALKADLEKRKQERRVRSRAEREAEKQRQWEIRKAKAKKRHRGR